MKRSDWRLLSVAAVCCILAWTCGGGDDGKTDVLPDKSGSEASVPDDNVQPAEGLVDRALPRGDIPADTPLPADLQEELGPDSGPGDIPEQPDAANEASVEPLDIKGELTLEEFLEAYDIEKMEPAGDDRESGAGMTDENGRAAFYSPNQNAMVEVHALDEEENPLPGMQVSGVLFDDGHAVMLVYDPESGRAPAMYIGETGDGTVEISSVDDPESVSSDFDLGGISPFEGNQFSLISISWTMVIKTTLKTMAMSAIASVVKKWVNELCLFAKPLHKEACGIAAEAASIIPGIVTGGVKLALGQGLTWSGLAKLTVDKVVDKLIDYGCGDMFKAVLLKLGPKTAAPDDANIALYKEVAWKYNYMMELADSETNPPDAAVWGEVKDGAVAGIQGLAYVKPMILPNFFLVYKPEKGFIEDQLSAKNIFGAAVKAVQKGMTEIVLDYFEQIQIDQILFEYKLFFTNSGKFIGGSWSFTHFHYERTTMAWHEETLPDNKLFDCAIAAIGGLTAAVQEGTENYLASVDAYPVNKFAHDVLVMLDAKADAYYKAAWGEDIPTPPPCLPDIWEPNDMWEMAPQVSNLGDTVTVEDLLLMPDDEDNYVFPIGGLINKVVAGVEWDEEQPGVEDCSFDDGDMCIELLWYSDMFEMLDMPPESFATKCEKLKKKGFWETDMYVLAPVMGETGPRIYVHVYPQNTSAVIPYKLLLYGTN